MAGLMRGSQPVLGYVTSSSSSSRRSWGSNVSRLWLMLLALGLGYWLGAHNSRQTPYPLDKAAFLPPPSELLQQQQQQQQQQQSAVAQPSDIIVRPPTISSDASSSSSLTTHATTQQLLTPAALQQLHPPVTPAKSGDPSYTVAPFQVLSWYPRVILFPNFLSRSQAQYFIGLAAEKLQPSELGVADVPSHPASGRTDGREVRNSHGVFLDRSAAPRFLGWLEERIAAVTMIPPSHGEDFNVLRYSPGQHYNSHMDTFDQQYLAHSDPEFGQRMATFLVYLSDVAEGGETVFKREGKYGALRHAGDLSSCAPSDFKVQPRQGDAILFWSLNHDLTVNPRALHGACPVVKGEKWVATKWLHDKPISEWDGEEEARQPH